MRPSHRVTSPLRLRLTLPMVTRSLLVTSLLLTGGLGGSGCDETRPASEERDVDQSTSRRDLDLNETDEGRVADAQVELDLGFERGDQGEADEGLAPPLPSPPITPYDPIPLVDPFIATGGDVAEIASVSPGASAPLGLTLIGPDTRRGVMIPPYHCAGYHYPDTHIQGFSHTHAHGMGVVDYGGISVMPRAQWTPDYQTFIGRQAPFSHEEEWASPGRYGVVLQDDGSSVDIIATPHGAHHRYLFPQRDDPEASESGPVIIVDLGDNLPNTETLAAEVISRGLDSGVESGARQAGDLSVYQLLDGQYSGRFGGVRHYAALRVDPAPSAIRGWIDEGELTEGALDEAMVWSGQRAGVVIEFPPGTDQVDLRVALSFVDQEGAWINLESELPDLSWETRLEEVETRWRERLNRVRVRGEARDVKRFTTAHYHSLLMPSLNSDVDGRYRGLDQAVHQSSSPFYSDLSLWDTFRTLHSFYLLAHPQLQRDVLRSLTQMIEDGGSLPRWPLAHGYTGGMVGTPAAQLFAEASLKELGGGWGESIAFDATLAQVMGEADDARRGGGEAYRELGWVPADELSGSVSRALEFAWSDFSLALWAERLGRPEASMLLELSGHWRNHWNPEAEFMIGRNRDGSWVEPRSDFAWDSLFVEGNAWHYLWYVPYDVEGMIETQHNGDRAAFLERYLAYWEEVYSEPDDLLPDDWYWHGNEPVMHYAWLGSLAGDHATTIRASHHVLETRYGHTELDGLDGNDDSGTLSAWYLWASMGLYPIAGTEEYALGAPIFDRVEVSREVIGGVETDEIDETDVTGETLLVIEAPGATWYREPQEISVGGEALTTPTLRHGQLSRGLQFRYLPNP